mmetsp:Transcript_22624/g.57778  ORF Transcript_22624/g.57778 Transcript_22624/m.57778 type:complete len:909 (+) Transcript_22624:80-2806(+)
MSDEDDPSFEEIQPPQPFLQGGSPRPAARIAEPARRPQTRQRGEASLLSPDAPGEGDPEDGFNIMVAVRCRALLPHEKAVGGRDIVKCADGKVIILMDPGVTAADDYLRLNKTREKRYAFDICFDQHDGQETVYNQCTKFLLDGTLNGFNATVFSYGATGAGKTFTMLGDYTQPGIMMMTMQDLFLKMDKERDNKTYEVKCSFLEVYNETIRDLLNPSAEASDHLDLREDPVKGMCVAGISEVQGLSTAEEIMNLLLEGNRSRTTEPTAANVVSSRSHAVLQVVVEQRDRTAGAAATIHVGKLSMIDLAGSERASQTNNRGIRMIEGANINRSLLALGNCITALSEKGAKNAFIPYRDSKLTRLLKDSLGGNCRTVMIAAIGPCHLNYDDTHNTLKYANRAKNIKTAVSRNVQNVNYHITKYAQIIQELRNEVTDLKSKLVAAQQECPKCTGGAPVTAMSTQSNTERADSETLKQQLNANYEERLGLKRSLFDLEEVIRRQTADRAATQTEISRREQDGVASAESTLRSLKEKLGSADAALQTHQSKKKELELRFADSMRQAHHIQKEINAKVQSPELRTALQTLLKNHAVEIEKLELEHRRKADQALLKQKNMEIEKLQAQLGIRDRMLAEHRELLTDGQLSALAKQVSQRPSPSHLRSPSEPSQGSPLRRSAWQEGHGLPPIAPSRGQTAAHRGERTPSPIRLPVIQSRGRVASRERAAERNKARSASRNSMRSAASDRDHDSVRTAAQREEDNRRAAAEVRKPLRQKAPAYLPVAKQGHSAPPVRERVPRRRPAHRQHRGAQQDLRYRPANRTQTPLQSARRGPGRKEKRAGWQPARAPQPEPEVDRSRFVNAVPASALLADLEHAGPRQAVHAEERRPARRAAKRDVLKRLNMAPVPPVGGELI